MHRGVRIGVLVLAALAIAAAWGVWSGSCADSGTADCVSRPMLGVPGAVIVTFVALVAGWWAARGLARRRGTDE